MPQPTVSLSDASRIVLSNDQVSCKLGDEAAIVNLKNGVYYGLDPVGARIWSVITQPITFAEIRRELLAAYDVDARTLDADIREFLHELAGQGLIEISS
jgi:hypothetical protein